MKRFLKEVYHEVITRIPKAPTKREAVLRFWKEADVTGYLSGDERSRFLLTLIQKYAQKNANIMELGCNCGRNLQYLSNAGFKHLSGVEINKSAVQRKITKALIYNASVEEKIQTFNTDEFEVVFTMAFLEHVHPASEWVFSEIARITVGVLITIEDEVGYSWNHFPRNYKRVFERLGMRQIEVCDCRGVDGLGTNFFARVFIKQVKKP